MPNDQPQSKPDFVEEPCEEGLSSSALLGLGLLVIETRSRNNNKDLGPWKPSVAFVDECNAEQYLYQYGTGYMRILRPDSQDRA